MDVMAPHICAWCGADQGRQSLVSWPEGMPVPKRGIINDVICPDCNDKFRADNNMPPREG